ncbi:MAG: hypothetical protein IKJ82_01910 [Oscillospiraceae bacterium]|nr:hypothetical protein [Oscillospiraceae bacterium]
MIFKDMDEIRRHLKIGIPLPCYFIGGADDKRKRTILNKIVSITTEGGSGFDNHRFSGNVSADAVADAAFEITFGGGRRAVVCEDIPFGNMSDNEYKKFEQLITEVSGMGGSTVLVFIFTSADADTVKKDSKPSSGKKNRFEALKKLIDKCGGGIIRCETPTTAELCSIIEKTCSKYKCSIHRDLCAYMVERCGNDSALLQNEARKVAEYKGSGIITKADIDLMTCATPDAKVMTFPQKLPQRTGPELLRFLRNFGKWEKKLRLSSIFFPAAILICSEQNQPAPAEKQRRISLPTGPKATRSQDSSLSTRLLPLKAAIPLLRFCGASTFFLMRNSV